MLVKLLTHKHTWLPTGSSSGICDGAAALVVAGDEAVKKYSLKPLMRIAGWSVSGVAPEVSRLNIDDDIAGKIPVISI